MTTGHPLIGNGRLNRRQLIQVGTAGLCGLTLPRLLAAEETTRPPARSCIFIILSGGPSHIDTFDPKPEAPREIRGLYETIRTHTPGIYLSEMFPRLAEQSQHYCLVRSLSHTDGVHVSAAHTMLTGQSDGSPNNDSPMLGSVISRLRPATGSMPSHVWLHNMKTGTNKVPKYDSGLTRVGHEHAAMRVGYELDNPTSSTFRVREFDPPAGITRETLSDRFRLLDELESAHPTESLETDRYQRFQERARELVTGSRARQAFDLNLEPDSVRDRYGRHPVGQYTLMARRLVEAGVRLVTVTAWPGLAPGETTPTPTQVWDTHGVRYQDGDSMYGNGPFGMKWSLPRLDQAVAALLGDLAERSLLEETLVVVVGEFGRTPKFENNGKGRDHWAPCYTGILAGGGIRGGTVYGSSDKQGAYVTSGRPISHVDFGATVYHTLGIPPETRYGPDGFSFRVSEGEPVWELFG